MSARIENIEINAFMGRHLSDVFQTMLSIEAVPAGQIDRPPHEERVSGSVGFGGDTVTGAVYLHLSTQFATRAAAAMLGLTPEELSGEAEVNDVVGEVTNMLGGGFKSWLCDAGSPCAMSTPAIIRGSSFDIEPMPGIERICRTFTCGDENVLLEVHIKFN